MPDSPVSDFAPPDLRDRLPDTPGHQPAPPERRGRGQRRVAWAGARARNARRRPLSFGVAAGIVFTATLFALILVPRQAQRAFARLMPRTEEWRDTAAARAGVDSARAAFLAARGRFLAARAAATAPPPAPPAPVVVLTPAQLRQRDSLQAAVVNLQRLLARVERSPLPASYRALGELPELAGDARVAQLLDSLAAVEREREEFAALGGVDPVYVALSTRLNAIGRSIQQVAQTHVAAAVRALDALHPEPPPPPPPVERPEVDTLTPMRAVLAAERAQGAAERNLAQARATNARLVVRAEQARRGANFIAPPLAVLGAALVLALAAGFTAALVAELRAPRVADAAEVERETHRRVLAVVRPSAPVPDRDRRRADVRTLDLLDPMADAYRMLYLHISPTGAALPIVTVTGDEPAVLAAVAANLAAAAAEDARSTLLLDADVGAGLVASALRVRRAPGVSELLRGEAAWPDTVTSAVFGRERVVDIVPAGRALPHGRQPEPDDAFRLELQRLARRYDLTVLTAPLAHACRGATSILPAPDVILCARAAATPVRHLRSAVAALQGAGLRVQGVVLWDEALPEI
jgi:tyrosine-protein kinase Etk/Wzc